MLDYTGIDCIIPYSGCSPKHTCVIEQGLLLSKDSYDQVAHLSEKSLVTFNTWISRGLLGKQTVENYANG